LLSEVQNHEAALERLQADRKQTETERLETGYKLEMLRAAIGEWIVYYHIL